MDRSILLNLVLESLREEVPASDSMDQEQLRLIGPQAVLKSVALVAVLVGIEERLQHRHGVRLSLMDDHAMSQSRSPFRTVGTLVDYLAERVAACS